MLSTILEIITGLFKAIPILNQWFTKTTEQKIEEGHQALDNEEQKLKDTGRPS